MEAKPYVSEICDNSQLSQKVVGDVKPTPPNYASHILPSDRDLDTYKKFELFFTDKNKFLLNNNFDRNHCKIFLQEKEKCLENMNLDDHINDDSVAMTSKEYSKNEDKKEECTNTINTINDITNNNYSSNTNNNYINCSDSQNNNSPVRNGNSNLNNNNNNRHDVFVRNQSNVSNTNYNNITNLFDTGKGDLLSIILGFGK